MKALLSLVQFDTEYEFVLRADADQCKCLPTSWTPRGNTALLDAVGRAINETGERLAKMAEKDRPGLVVFVITTDGLENSSKEFSKAQIKEMVDATAVRSTNGNSSSSGLIRTRSRKPEALASPVAGAANLRSWTKFMRLGVALPQMVGRMRKQRGNEETVIERVYVTRNWQRL